jgi:predicted dehydrogenase
MMYSFGIIGAGKISSEYDDIKSENVLTHAHAIVLNSDSKLLGFYDVDVLAATRASNKWGGKAYKTFDELMSHIPDVIIVATPDETHAEILGQILHWMPKIVICEKPLTLDYKTSVNLIRAYSEKGITLVVNYQRRFDPSVFELKRKIANRELGPLVCGSVLYSKGLMHNGSHAIDFLRFLFGEVSEFLTLKKFYDFTEKDPSVSGFLRFKDGDVTLIAANENFFSIFEIDLIFEKYRYKFSHSGMFMEIQEPKADDTFTGYIELFSKGLSKTGFTNSISGLIEECILFLSSGISMRNLASDILGTQALCEQMTEASEAKFIKFKIIQS